MPQYAKWLPVAGILYGFANVTVNGVNSNAYLLLFTQDFASSNYFDFALSTFSCTDLGTGSYFSKNME